MSDHDGRMMNDVRQHELDTAQRLADLGDDVTFVPAPGTDRVADIEMNGARWELKSPVSSNPNTRGDPRRSTGPDDRAVSMANMAYVIVGPGPSLADVHGRVVRETRSSVRGGWRYPADDDRVTLRVIVDPEASGGHVVQVLRAGDPISARQEFTRDVFDALMAATDWDLTLDSDDSEGVLASRTKTAPGAPST